MNTTWNKETVIAFLKNRYKKIDVYYNPNREHFICFKLNGKRVSVAIPVDKEEITLTMFKADGFGGVIPTEIRTYDNADEFMKDCFNK